MRTRLIAPTVAAVALFAAFTPRPAEAQVSIWLQRGVDGYGGFVGLATNGTDALLSLSGGYSYQGFLDFDLGLAFIGYDDFFGDGTEVSALTISPGIQYHPLKQSDNLPFSLGLGAVYNYTIYSSDELDAAGIELTGWSISGSVNVYRFFKLSGNFGIIPAVAGSYVYESQTLSDGVTDMEGTVNSFSVALGAYLGYLDASNRIWGIIPSVSIPVWNDLEGSDPDVIFGIQVGLIFSKPPPEPVE